MKYAPIKSILARDFRNLQEVVIDFTDSPIVSLVGENEAGKSSVVKAVTTVGANLDPNRQKEYIRTGTKGFTIAIKFDDADGTIVARQKGPGLNCYFVQKGSEVVWSVQKMDDSSVPPEIQQYMGFVLEPETKELLNVRTYEDLMIFIHTANSTNYKIMYNALKVESLMKAKRLGQLEVNSYKSDISRAESSINTLTEQLRKIKLVDLDPLLAIREKLTKEQATMRAAEEAAKIKDRLNQLEEESKLLKETDSLKGINEMEVYLLNNLYDNYQKLNQLNRELVHFDNIDKLETIDTSLLESMENVLRAKEKLAGISVEAYADIEKAELIDTATLDSLKRAVDTKSRLETLKNKESLYSQAPEEISLDALDKLESLISKKNELMNYNSQVKDLEDKIDELEEYMKQSGVMVTTCRNCGSTVIFGEV